MDERISTEQVSRRKHRRGNELGKHCNCLEPQTTPTNSIVESTPDIFIVWLQSLRGWAMLSVIPIVAQRRSVVSLILCGESLSLGSGGVLDNQSKLGGNDHRIPTLQRDGLGYGKTVHDRSVAAALVFDHPDSPIKRESAVEIGYDGIGKSDIASMGSSNDHHGFCEWDRWTTASWEQSTGHDATPSDTFPEVDF
jgi:hypothetical protein